MAVNDEDMERVGRDLFRRHNFGITALKATDIDRAQYCYDGLTSKFEEVLKTENELYKQCINLFGIGQNRKIEQREEINLLLMLMRELVAMTYVPIVGEKNLQYNRKITNKYYDKFIRNLSDKEQFEKINEFKKIFENLYIIKEKLKQTNNRLQSDVQFFKSLYWMLSICYRNFSSKFYDFNLDKFCHYVEDEGEEYFETYNRTSGQDTQKRINYMKEYIEKQLKLDVDNCIEAIKENKKSIIYKRDMTVSKEEDWISPLLEQQLTTRRETMEISEIIRHIKDNRFIVRPHYQRGEVRNKTKASRVIESIILGVKLPPIYLYTEIPKNGLSRNVVLDRTTTID